MTAQDDLLVRVHREWDGWRSAEVRLSDLRDIHWLQPAHAPHQLVHGFVPCTGIVTGELTHSCDPASAPHSLLVCVLKRHAMPSVYAELARRAERVSGRGEAASPAALAAARQSRVGF